MCLEILGLCELTSLNERLFFWCLFTGWASLGVGMSSTGYKAVSFLFRLCLQKMSHIDPELENN